MSITSENGLGLVPISRLEKFLSRIGTGIGEIPEYYEGESRKDTFLRYICEHGLDKFFPAYDTSKQYEQGEYVIYNGDIYKALEATTGTFDPSKWDKLTIAESLEHLQTQINILRAFGKFLSYWDCTTGLPESNPEVMPYTCQTGDYYIITKIAEEGGTNYKPNGTIYNGTASTVVETADVTVSAIYQFDGRTWLLFNSYYELLKHYAKTDGYYKEMTVGLAENLIDTKAVGTAQSFVYRTSAGTVSIQNDAVAEIRTIKGAVKISNQLAPLPVAPYIDTTTPTATTPYIWALGRSGAKRCSILTDSATGRKYIRISGDDGSASGTLLKVNGSIGDKFYIRFIVRELENQNGFGLSFANKNLSGYGGRSFHLLQNIIETAVDNPTFKYSGGYWGSRGFDIKDIAIINLTLLCGAGNEPTTTTEAENLVGADYIQFDTGTLKTFTATGIKTVGFNAYNVATGKAEVLAGNQYQITGTHGALTLNGTTITPDADGLFTPTKTGTLNVAGGDNTTCVHLVWSGYRNGDYEEYWEEIRQLPIADYFPNGMLANSSAYDELTKDKAIQRLEIVDGTITVLDTPIVTEIDPPLNFTYRVADFGTEEIIGSNGVNINAVIKYNDDLTRQIVNNTEKKIDKVTDAVSGNVAIFDNDGNVVDSDVAVNTLQSTDNLVAAFNEEPSDINYPSEKLVKDTFGLMGITIDKLWENPNPDTERGRSVELPSDGYDRYIVVVKYNLTYDIYINIIVSGDGKTYGGAIHRTGENFTYGTVSISNKQMTSNSAADTSFIPVEIYGIKVNINDLTTGA